jgi:hypothetical protein
MYSALHDTTKLISVNADIQAMGIANYALADKDSQTHRDRCMTGTPCWIKKKMFGQSQDTQRWFNIFEMNGVQALEHGFSTGTRGGASNVPEFDYTGGPCNGQYPCEDRLQKFYMPCANADGNFYLDNIHCVICNAYRKGDRTGEFAYNPTQGLRQWQMVAAMTGWLNAFGRHDASGQLYFTTADVRAMLMEGRYPDGWQPREWGGLTDFADAMAETLTCLDPGNGYYEPWWQDTSCPSYTGEDCTSYVGYCGGGASCISGKCLCGLGSNNVAMCARNGQCVERENKCEYFGEKCNFIAADNPSAPF